MVIIKKNSFFFLLFTTQTYLLKSPRQDPFENIVGKGENAVYQHFLLFPQCFQPYQRQNSLLQLLLFCCLKRLSIWTRQGKGLKVALQILVQKFYKNTKKPLFSETLWIFIHKNPSSGKQSDNKRN